MKKQSCRMTQQEREAHKEAIKLRKMTDQQLVDHVNGLKERAEKAEEEAEKSKIKVVKAEAEAAKYAKNAAIAVKNRNTGGKAVVESFLQALKAKTGSGNGIGNGTIFKLKRILDEMPDDFAEKEA